MGLGRPRGRGEVQGNDHRLALHRRRRARGPGLPFGATAVPRPCGTHGGSDGLGGVGGAVEVGGGAPPQGSGGEAARLRGGRGPGARTRAFGRVDTEGHG